MRKALALLFFISFYLISYSQNEVIYIWSGGITPYSANVNAKLTYPSTSVRLVASTSLQFTNAIYSAYYSVDTTTGMMVAMTISGLQPDTKYYYAVESANIFDTSPDDIGSFTTFHPGACSYSFVVGSCCSNSNHGVYDAMANVNPLFYLNTGDLHYSNPNSATDINVHRRAYENDPLSKLRSSRFLKKIPIAYMWDDHDYCGNDSDSSFVGKKNARLAYREFVPHYPLPAGPGNQPIYQSFVVGRVHFILTDLRSDRYGSSMMGTQQKAWFKNECLIARNNKEIIAWVSTDTWNSVGWTDNWGGFTTERAELSNFFRDSLINNMFILSGDAHMLAIDNGSHADFSTFISNGAWYPIFQAAALAQGGSYKGGIFSEGYFPNPNVTPQFGQFGKVDVSDNGGSDICISFSGYRVDTGGAGLTFINYYSFCRTLDPMLGIKDTKSLSADVKLFPDPSSGEFTIALDADLKDVEVRFFDMSGRELFSPALTFQNDLLHVDACWLPNGIYLVRITSNGETAYKKLVISK